jgi:Transglutaminase-like superfamily
MILLQPHSAELNKEVTDFQQMEADAETDEAFLAFARSIVSAYPFSGNEQLTAIKKFAFVNIKYQPDPFATELFTSPHRMMELIQAGNAFGDCDCQAIFCTAVCRALGYNAHIVLIDQEGTGFNHAYSEVYSEETGITYTLDSTQEGPLVAASPLLKNEPGGIYPPSPAYKIKFVVP